MRTHNSSMHKNSIDNYPSCMDMSLDLYTLVNAIEMIFFLQTFRGQFNLAMEMTKHIYFPKQIKSSFGAETFKFFCFLFFREILFDGTNATKWIQNLSDWRSS